MEIKPPGSGKPFFEPPKESREVAKKNDRTFVTGKPDPKAPPSGPTGGGPHLGRLRNVSAQFRREDLQDPEKVETIIGSSIHELINTEFPEVGRMPETHKKFLADWMTNDPIVRSKILAYLQRVLK